MQNIKSTRVLLADDHGLMRAGIRALLEKIPGVTVVGEAADGLQALHLVKSAQPDVVLMDITMANLNGLEAAGRLAREAPTVKVIILSMHANEECVLRALRAGVAGYLLKDSAAGEVQLALETVARGETYLSRAISSQVLDDYQAGSRPLDPIEVLTSRQREILQLICEGKTTKETAFQLNLSAKTVETHRADLMKRLKIYDVASLVRLGIRSGLVSGEG